MKISVITVCFNAQTYISQTIASVLGQDYPDIEYIIVDGGSTDQTIDIVKGYTGDARLRWCSGPDEGIADAMNKGAALATGEIVAYLNSDDYYPHPGVVSHVVDCFRQHPETIWLTGGFDFVAEDETFLRSIKVRRYSFRRLVRGNIILHPSTFIRSDTFRATGGFDPALRYCMDYDLFLRLGEMCPPFLLDEQLSCFRVHAASRTISESELSYEEEFQVRLNFLRQRGESAFFYRLDFQVKRILNRLFYRKLSSIARDTCQC